ncbi:hypothetical protein IWX88_000138 [Frigoribacterium sp. CG_9.8]|nr:hypothetical protein [Frigoribacterium sp. CG_9.8]
MTAPSGVSNTRTFGPVAVAALPIDGAGALAVATGDSVLSSRRISGAHPVSRSTAIMRAPMVAAKRPDGIVSFENGEWIGCCGTTPANSTDPLDMVCATDAQRIQ